MRTHPIPALNPVISPASTATLNASRASLANALLLDLLARGMLKNKVMPTNRLTKRLRYFFAPMMKFSG
jgi:hypothetical protein